MRGIGWWRLTRPRLVVLSLIAERRVLICVGLVLVAVLHLFFPHCLVRICPLSGLVLEIVLRRCNGGVEFSWLLYWFKVAAVVVLSPRLSSVLQFGKVSVSDG